jgi:hypothetical protein
VTTKYEVTGQGGARADNVLSRDSECNSSPDVRLLLAKASGGDAGRLLGRICNDLRLFVRLHISRRLQLARQAVRREQAMRVRVPCMTFQMIIAEVTILGGSQDSASLMRHAAETAPGTSSRTDN